MGRNHVHDRLVRTVEERLRDKDYYHVIEQHHEYHSSTGVGELDVIAIRGLWAHYYEVKSHPNERALSRAEKQFRRAARAYPMFRWKFVLVTRYGVCRWHPERGYTR